jgi:ketosteroid isomerase-like protein
MVHTAISPTEQADRLAIRELVDAYAHCADRRDAEGQKALFTEDTHLVVYMDGQGSAPTQVLDGREALTPVFDDLNRYQATMHFNGQSTITLDGVRATGESYCIAHHLFTEDGERNLMVAWLRYHDTFVKPDDAWLFAERNLYVDWTETRPSRS